MPFDGNGNYSLPAPPYPAVAGTAILAADWNTIMADIQAALSACVTRDGQSALTGNLDVATFDLLNARATTPGTSTTGKQVQTSAGVDAKIAAALETVGTWSPVPKGSLTAGTYNPLTLTGNYIKQGKFVFVSATVIYNSLTGTGDLVIGGLPFAPSGPAMLHVASQALTFSGQLIGKIGGTDIALYGFSTALGLAGVPVDTGATIYISGCYQTA